jgi:hypothetical protein
VQDIRDIGLAGMTIQQTFTGVFRTVSDFSQLGQTSLRNKAALRSLTSTTDEYLAKLEAVQRATRQTTTDSEAAAIAARLQQFGLADTADEMAEFVDTITRVGAVNPMLGSTSEAIEQIQLTLSNMSFMRLDQLGISAGDVRDRIAELKNEMPELSSEVAFQTAVMEALETQASRVSDETMEIGAAQQRAGARFREFKDDVGENVTAALDEAIEAADQLGTLLNELGTTETVLRVAYEVTGTDRDAAKDASFLEHANTYALGAPFMIASALGVDSRNAFVAGGITPYRSDPVRRPETLAEYMNAATIARRTRMLADPFSRTMVRRPGPQYQFGVVPPEMQGRGAQALAEQSDIWSTYQRLGYSREDVYARKQAQQEAEFQAGMRRTAGIRRHVRVQRTIDTVGDYIGQGAGIFKDMMFSPMAAGAQELAGAIRRATGATQEWAGSLEHITSVAQKMGVEGASPFNADLYNRAVEGMRNASLETEQMAEAQQALGLELGTTNAANEIFNRRMDVIAQALAEGRLSLSEYVNEVQHLGQMETAGIEWLAGRMSTEDQMRMIDVLGSEEGAQAWENVSGGITSLLGRGEDEEANTFQGVITDSELMANAFDDQTKRMTDTAMETWGNIQGGGSEAFATFREDADKEISEVEATLKRLEAVEVLITMSVNRSEGTVRNLPEFQEGGWTGAGNQPFLAVLHPNEFVLSEQMLNNIKRNNQPALPPLAVAGQHGQSTRIEVPVLLDGRQIASVVRDVDRRENVRGVPNG